MSDRSVEETLLTASPTPSVLGNVENIIYVEFEDRDQRNPRNFSLLSKWVITLTACYFSGMTVAASSSFSISVPSLTHDLHCTALQAGLGLALYTGCFSIVPLITSSFSEEVGRRPVYIFSSVMYALTQVMVALAPNIEIVLAGRALGGIFGSTGAALVGGSIADIWRLHERGLPMTIFAFSSLFGLGLGSLIGDVIQSGLGWRWVQWIHVMFSCLFIITMALWMSETRSSIILTQIARSRRKFTGNASYKAKAENDKESLWSLIKTSCTRPLYFLLTEPIVQSFSIWCSFTWGVVYCLLKAITPMFQTIYAFDVEQTGYVYTTMIIGAIFGLLANLLQDELYRRHFPQKKQEARLYLACAAAPCLPIGMFIFAWTALPQIYWLVPMIGLSVFMIGVMVILQVTFLYLADCYNIYASSAQAGLSLSRNLMALVFPLFTQQLFAALTYKWALTLFAILALVMAPTPFVLFFYGSRIRARSIASREISDADAQAQQSFSMPSLSSHPELDRV